jgi:hypothetical protein
MSLLSVELSRERIREREQEIDEIHAIALMRANRCAPRNARGWAFRARRTLLTR